MLILISQCQLSTFWELSQIQPTPKCSQCPIVLYLIFTDYSSFIMIVVVHCNKYCIVLYICCIVAVITKSVQSQCIIKPPRPYSACQEGSGHGDWWQDGIWSWRIWAETGTIVTIMTMKDDPTHRLELETNFCEVFTITEKAPYRAVNLLI